MFSLAFPVAFVIVLKISVVFNQNIQSPCPDIFHYERDGSNIIGKIVLRGRRPVSQLELVANFAVSGYVAEYGNIELENAMFALQGYNQGLPMQYKVHFPNSPTVPIITAITVNGQKICSGPKVIPRANQIVTNFSLKQISYLRGTGQEFGVIQPQPSQYNILNGFLIENPNEPTQDGDDNLSNALSNIYTNKAVQKEPVTKPETSIILIPLTPQKTVPNEVFGQYIPREQTLQPRDLVTTERPLRQAQAEPLIECGTRSSGNDRLALVYNGRNYMRGDLPWLVAIFQKKANSLKFICGGTLVSNRHVVTAAHCMWHGKVRSGIRDIVVKVGVHTLDDWDDEIPISRTLIDAAVHESFNVSTLQNDILVLTFTKRVKFNDFIRPACLWDGDDALDRIVGSFGTVAGWGSQANVDAGAGEPQLIKVPIVKTDTCRLSNLAFYKITSETSFCAGDRNGSGPCTGDSGGGLYLLQGGKWRLRGIVSFALKAPDGSCDLSDYVVYTDTAKFLPWIRQVLAKDNFD